MNLEDLRENWDGFGKTDPLWAILTDQGKRKNKWNPEEFFKTGEQQVAADLGYLESLGIQPKKGTALDFGCGVGRLTQALGRYFAEVRGVDIAPTMIDLAGKYNRLGAACKYYVNETDSLQIFADQSFDFVYSQITLQHMEPRYAKRYILEFLRVMANDGVLFFQLPAEHVSEKRGMRQLILDRVEKVCPQLLSVYRKKRYGGPWKMQMFETPAKEMESFLNVNGGNVVDMRREVDEYGFVNILYCVLKK